MQHPGWSGTHLETGDIFKAVGVALVVTEARHVTQFSTPVRCDHFLVFAGHGKLLHLDYGREVQRQREGETEIEREERESLRHIHVKRDRKICKAEKRARERKREREG